MRALESAHPGSAYQNFHQSYVKVEGVAPLICLPSLPHCAKRRRNQILVRNPRSEGWVCMIQMLQGSVHL